MRKNLRTRLFLLSVFTLLASVNLMAIEKQTLYYGGDIITMEGNKTNYVEAVLERDGKIIYVGKKADAVNNFAGKTLEVDLKGKTMMPGFIEPHLHPSIAAIMLPNDTIAPHDWTKPDGVSKAGKTPEEYMKRLKIAIDNHPAKEGIWGYHQLWHGKELSRDLLTKLAPNKPVAVIHRSFHEIFLNDKAIELFKITKEDFKGNPQVEWEKGHFFEGGWFALLPKISAYLLDPDTYKEGLHKMTQLMLKNGVTTICEPGFPSSNFEMEYGLLKIEMDKNPPYDTYLIPNGTQVYSMAGNSNKKAEVLMQSLA